MTDRNAHRKPRLLVLSTTFPRWENDDEPPFVFDLCRRLDEFEVHVIAPHVPGAQTEETMETIRVHRFRYAPEKLETLAYDGGISANLKRAPWKYMLLQGFLLSMFFRAMRVGHQHNIHLIHAHWMIPTGLIGAALKELLRGKNRLLVTAHGGDVLGLRGKLFSALRRWVARESDQMTVVGSGLLEVAKTEQWPKFEDIQIAPMGVDLQHLFVPAPEKRIPNHLVFAGRLVEKKGVQHLIEAMPAIVNAVPTARLTVLGDGPLSEPLKSRVNELGLNGRVAFHGRYKRDALPALLQQASLVVLPFDIAADGDAEGLGLTLVEAMGCGLPVLAGNVAAIHDIVEHRVNGILIDSKAPSLLAKQTVELLADEPRRTLLGKNAREHALAHFDWNISAARYVDLITGVLE